MDLTATTGPLKGSRFIVDDELLIGRTTRGVNLPDPTVSVNHARLRAFRDGAVIEDLGSATGTMVNGTDIRGRNSVQLDLGDEVVIGETTFVVGSGRKRAVRTALLAMIPVWGVVFAAMTAVFWITGDRPATVGLPNPIHTHEGTVQELTFPRDFLREHGIRLDRMALRQVTDLDADGIDELWLQDGDREYLLTFQSDGAWVVRADLPLGCTIRQGTAEIFCGQSTFRVVDGTYAEVAQQQPVVWLTGPVERPEVPEGEEAPPLPPRAEVLQAGGLAGFRMVPGSSDRIAGFLADRGITEPVHAILCEDAVAGLPAQVVTQAGEAVRLSFPCADAIRVGGPKGEAYTGSRVAAIALSAPGHAALPSWVGRARSGDPRGLFLSDGDREVIAQLRRWPHDPRGGLQLTWKDTPHIFEPVATGEVAPPARLLVDGPAPAETVSATIYTGEPFVMDVPGSCAKLEVTTSTFRCATLRGCLPGAGFARVRQVGCGVTRDLLVTGYGDGVWAGADEHVDVRVEVETDGGLFMTDVVRATVAARPIVGG